MPRLLAAPLAVAVLTAGSPRSAPPEAAAARIIAAELEAGRAFEILRHLTDRIGPRLSGSPGAEAAVRWTLERLRADGLDARQEPVQVPVWVRGEEKAQLVGAVPQRLVVTALGGSVPTPEGGITAEVTEVDGLEALRALGPAPVRGKIVLFNRAMTAGQGMRGYGEVSPLRTRGASEAARLGAVAALVRSLGTLSARLPHTGAVNYAADAPRIPAAALATEDAELLHRLLSDGERVSLRLDLGCRSLADAPSANVVADLPGRERPEEIVLIAAHLDSWDLGTGAIDDGAGCAMVMESLRLLKSLGLVPRRTIRGVLYMNEENGLRGGRAYAEAHRAELGRHVAAIEADSGGALPIGFSVTAGAGGLEIVSELAALTPGATEVTEGGGGADISLLRAGGVPLLGLRSDASRYFDWHHSAADTLDKVVPEELARSAAALAVMAYALAEMEGTLPRPSAEQRPQQGGGREQ